MVLLVLRERKAQPVLKATKAPKVSPAPLELRVRRELRAQPDHLGLKVQLEQLERKEARATKDSLAQTVRLVPKVHRVPKALLVPKDFRVVKVRPVLRVLKATKDLLGQRARRVPSEVQGHRDLKALKASLEQTVRRERKVLKV
jgi:hypothetical protein